MLIIVSALAVMSLVKVSIETPVPDNSQTQYCVADVKYKKHEQHVGESLSCTKGSMKVESTKPSLADRKAK